MEYSITDNVTLPDAIRYAEEIYDSEIINSYIDSKRYYHEFQRNRCIQFTNILLNTIRGNQTWLPLIIILFLIVFLEHFQLHFQPGLFLSQLCKLFLH